MDAAGLQIGDDKACQAALEPAWYALTAGAHKLPAFSGKAHFSSSYRYSPQSKYGPEVAHKEVYRVAHS